MIKKHQITINPTNHPKIVKFTSNQLLTKGGSFQYENIDEAKDSPLAKQLFHLPFVSKVFISTNFIAVERFENIVWEDVQQDLKELIMMYLNEGNAVILENAKSQKIVAEIYAESTPNPQVMKFGTNRFLSEMDFEYKNKKEAANAPLALEIFKWKWVKEIYIAENYVSITKKENFHWEMNVINETRIFLKKYLEAGKLVVDPYKNLQKNSPKKDLKTLSETEKEIINILDTHIKPAVAADGGNISFENYDENSKVVSVILQGACSGCPSSKITLKNGIETMLKEMLPDKIDAVEAING